MHFLSNLGRFDDVLLDRVRVVDQPLLLARHRQTPKLRLAHWWRPVLKYLDFGSYRTVMLSGGHKDVLEVLCVQLWDLSRSAIHRYVRLVCEHLLVSLLV